MLPLDTKDVGINEQHFLKMIVSYLGFSVCIEILFKVGIEKDSSPGIFGGELDCVVNQPQEFDQFCMVYTYLVFLVGP